MGIKDKQTYGEYYWAMQVEANREFDENIETAFAPYFSGVLSGLPDIAELPPGMQSLVRLLGEPPSAGFGGFALGVGVEMVDETLGALLGPMMQMIRRKINASAKETWLKSSEANTLFRQGKIESDFWKLTVESEGYEDILAKFLYESQMPYPTLPDLILYSRYHASPDNVWGEIQKWHDVPARDWPVWEWLQQQQLTADHVQTLFRRGIMPDHIFDLELARIGWDVTNRAYMKELGYTIPNAMLLVQGNLQQNAYDDKIISDISKADIHPDYAQLYLDAILTKPSSQDMIAYHLRSDPGLSGIDVDLKRIGIHPDYNEIYKTLAHPIPPVADIITMAVREAFSPEIAARFGQYEDYPPEFEVWAEKKGLTPEWSKRYWAAHWSLPSANQGFDMLHRGIIDESELRLLLRALDVMPFWRDKLLKIAYKIITRVDVRRMYSVGVMDESEVYEAYSEQGYNERDARRMTEFTVRQVLSTQSKFTATDIVSAFTKYMITRPEAESLLRDIGVRSENISVIISSAEYKREWALTDSRIAAVKNLYKKAVYDENKARSELLRLDLPAVRVDILMQEWYIEEKDKPARYWTVSQTLSFIKDKMITPQRGRLELENIGYDDEHINIYLQASQ